ncbi:biotin/lipoate A/B protein ligase family protein [Halorubrum gandharaense]
MELVRGREPTVERDRAATAAALDRAGENAEEVVRVWATHRQVAFGRRDTRADGYERAAAAARSQGFEPVERSVGGRAVAYTGRTLAFAVGIPQSGMRTGITERYDLATETVVEALRDIGADVEPDEPPDAFCPGDHSVRVAGGGKVSGIAQRVRADAALVSGCVLVEQTDTTPIASVLEPVYAALGVAFDPESVGSVAAAGGPDSSKQVAAALETALADAWDDADGSGAPADRRIRTLAERPLVE